MSFIKKLLLLTLLFLLVFSSVAGADSPFVTYTVDRSGSPLITQSAYQAIGLIDGSSIEEYDESGEPVYSPLSNPEDLFIDQEDRIYVADSGNSRIVVFDQNGQHLQTLGEDKLQEPTGVFVTNEGMIFVADYRQEKIFQFDQEGQVVQEIGRPDTLLFGQRTPFKPRKVIVDQRNNLYVVSEGSIHGLIQLSSEGSFQGYFGANITGGGFTRALQRLFFTDEQLSRLGSQLPPSITNTAIDEEGLIYTTTLGVQQDEIKKLNVAGNNLLPSQRYAFLTYSGRPTVSAIAINEIGNIIALDAQNSMFYEYDREGNLLFVFGGEYRDSQRLGLFQTPLAIAVNSEGMLFVLDQQRNNIQLLRPTEFTNVVHSAIALYNDGRYVESEELWAEVLRYNSMFDLAQTGIGMAAFKRGDYEQALESFVISRDKREYSNAYWEIRREWLMNNASWILLTIVGFAIANPTLKRLHRRTSFANGLLRLIDRVKNQALIKHLGHVFRIMRHPFEGFWELRNEGKASVRSATILYILFFIVYVFELFTTSFLFSNLDVINLSLTTELYILYIPIIAWVISNYLVSTINDGEGRFRDVYTGTAYALSPYIVFGIPLAILSNGLTLMEKVIYDYTKIGIILWCAMLVVIMVKEIHDYEIGKTIKNIFITIFGMIMIGIIAFIVFGLSNQVWDFIYSIIQEVRVRG
ncbi:YIP1 family protein [Caldalkalibacillus horti]|uniref:DNA-binding beta-propeller fold protein YncE n=1 Tax=Caldalkalibacillus horti TaxID=77523 RepID=A0ABT9W5Q5_9BACI|nr:YIP1 family protein [Bacillus horti]MDQ0168407.1 DNA-binding beta-propeller fold protein YncE [Bacillus horti]